MDWQLRTVSQRDILPVYAIIGKLQSHLNKSIRMKIQPANHIFAECRELENFYVNVVTLRHQANHHSTILDDVHCRVPGSSQLPRIQSSFIQTRNLVLKLASTSNVNVNVGSFPIPLLEQCSTVTERWIFNAARKPRGSSDFSWTPRGNWFHMWEPTNEDTQQL